MKLAFQDQVKLQNGWIWNSVQRPKEDNKEIAPQNMGHPKTLSSSTDVGPLKKHLQSWGAWPWLEEMLSLSLYQQNYKSILTAL